MERIIKMSFSQFTPVIPESNNTTLSSRLEVVLFQQKENANYS